MAFERNVLIGERVYISHEVRTISHELDNGMSSIMVRSTDREGLTIDTWYSMEIDQSMTFEQAEEYVKGLDSFEPYVDPLQEAIDQLLPTLDDDQAETVINFFHEWETGKAYVVGDRVRYQNVLYRCIQAHTSQSDWTPDVSASLWVRTSPASEDDDPTTIPEWVQPAGAQDAYNTGDRVIFNGVVYESTVDGNVWSPTDYPAGWVVVE